MPCQPIVEKRIYAGISIRIEADYHPAVFCSFDIDIRERLKADVVASIDRDLKGIVRLFISTIVKIERCALKDSNVDMVFICVD